MIYHICLYCIQIALVSYSHMVPGCLDTTIRELVTRCVQLGYYRRPSTQDCLRLLVQPDVDKESLYSYNQTGFIVRHEIN